MPLGPTLPKSVVWAPEHSSAAAPPEGTGRRNQTASEAGWAEENLNSPHTLQLSSRGPKLVSMETGQNPSDEETNRAGFRLSFHRDDSDQRPAEVKSWSPSLSSSPGEPTPPFPSGPQFLPLCNGLVPPFHLWGPEAVPGVSLGYGALPP